LEHAFLKSTFHSYKTYDKSFYRSKYSIILQKCRKALEVEINEISKLIASINQQIIGITSEVNNLKKELREGNQINISTRQN
jgi:septal ring factor EnvC (AmiA/AmiB activator)